MCLVIVQGLCGGAVATDQRAHLLEDARAWRASPRVGPCRVLPRDVTNRASTSISRTPTGRPPACCRDDKSWRHHGVQSRRGLFYQGRRGLDHGGFRARVQGPGQPQSIAGPRQSTEGSIVSIIPSVAQRVHGMDHEFHQQAFVQGFQDTSLILSRNHVSQKKSTSPRAHRFFGAKPLLYPLS